MTGVQTMQSAKSRNLVLAAMIFAVSMMFIDQTIVSIAAPNIQEELGLTATGVQWAINAYLLSLAAFFAFGGRLADTVGHRRMVTLGVLVFAGASAMCGLTPKGSIAEAWLVTFRAVQGFGGAIMFPAALAIVVQTFSLHERGKALALFFGIAGGLTAVGPALGGVPDPVDVAGDLLGQHPGRRDRARPDRAVEAGHRAQAGQDGLPRAARARHRGRAQHRRVPAVGDVGLDRSAHDRVRRRRRGAARRLLLPRAADGVAADQRGHLPDPPVLRREPRPRDLEPRVHPGLLLRERVLAALARQVGVGREPRAALFLPRVRRGRADRRADARPRRGEAARSSSAARSPPSASGSGARRSRASTPARRSGS